MAAIGRVVIVHQASVGQTPQAPPAPAAPRAGADQRVPNAAELRAQIKQSIRDAAQEGARVQIGPDGSIIVRGDRTLQGMTGVPPYNASNVIPPQAVDMAYGFFTMCAVMVVGWPLARAFGRRIERRGETGAALPAAMTDQLQRIEQAVEAMSIEVERISESQRFMARLQTQGAPEPAALPSQRR